MKSQVAGVLLMLLLSGCESSHAMRPPKLPHHSFEKRLLVADRSVPFLTEAEWMEMKPVIDRRSEYVFVYAVRLKLDLVRADLKRKGDPEERTGLSIFFELKEGVWTENPALEEEVVVLL